jgi:hypothetical protein
MALTYDFDIFDVIPADGSSDPQLDGFLSDVGFRPWQEAATVALFRDPRTAEALRAAPASLRDYFLDAGFGLNTYASGAPQGRYPAKDEAARLVLIHRLAARASHFALPMPEGNAEGGDIFRLGAFLAELEQATPIELAEPVLAIDHSAGPVTARVPGLPPLFETVLISAMEDDTADRPPQRRKFWQNRFFRIGTAAILVIGATQLASGPALFGFASL